MTHETHTDNPPPPAPMNRREFLLASAASAASVTLLAATTSANATSTAATTSVAAVASPSAKTKILIAYYSWSGNTRAFAAHIQKLTGGDLFEIKPKKPYPADYSVCVKQARVETAADLRPEITGGVADIAEYDFVFVGSPNWWSTIAPPVATFLAAHNLAGKTITPFCTHGGGGKARLFENIEKLTPNSRRASGFALSAEMLNRTKQEIEKWVRMVLAENPNVTPARTL
jgi:flavodoxin